MTSQDRLRDYVLRLRQDLSIGQEEFARRCRLSTGWIGRLETGTLVGQPKLSTLRKISEGTGRPLHELLEAAGIPAQTSGFSIPNDIPEPPDEWERLMVSKLGSLGPGDRFRFPDFWYLDRDARRRILVMQEQVLREYEQAKARHAR